MGRVRFFIDGWPELSVHLVVRILMQGIQIKGAVLPSVMLYFPGIARNENYTKYQRKRP